MNYFAIIENGIVVNIIIGPLPNGIEGIEIIDRPVAIGDLYENNIFIRDGKQILTDAEKITILEARIKELEGK